MSFLASLAGIAKTKSSDGGSAQGTMKRYSNTTEYSFSTPEKVVVEADSVEYEWLGYLQNWGRDPNRDRKLVRFGIPDKLRGIFWKRIAESTDLSEKNPSVYQHLVEADTDPEAVRMIKQDIRRTFPTQIKFKGFTMQGAMFNVLKAYSSFDPHIGYCQGMSFICGVLLHYMNEEDAFWMFVQLNKTYKIGNLFTPGLPLLQNLVYKLDRLTQILLPELFLHLKQENVNPLMYASEWFSTIYSYNVPLPLTARIWDVFLVDGVNYLLKVALALLKISERELMKLRFERIIFHLKEKANFITAEHNIFGLADSFHSIDPLLVHIEQKMQQEIQQSNSAKVSSSPSPTSSSSSSTTPAEAPDTPQAAPEPVELNTTSAVSLLLRKDYPGEHDELPPVVVQTRKRRTSSLLGVSRSSKSSTEAAEKRPFLPPTSPLGMIERVRSTLERKSGSASSVSKHSPQLSSSLPDLPPIHPNELAADVLDDSDDGAKSEGSEDEYDVAAVESELLEAMSVAERLSLADEQEQPQVAQLSHFTTN